MSAEHLVIVGGGPGGLATARAYREAGGRGSVTILAAEEAFPYRRPPLTKEFLRGEVPRSDLPMEGSSWYAENDVEVETGTTAFALDRAQRVVRTDRGDFPYDFCVLATGSEPIRIPVPGADDPRVLVMRTVEDSEALRSRTEGETRVVVVGSGFIGCEAAASLARRGASVTLVTQEEAPQAARLGPEVAQRIRAWLEGEGVDLRFGVDVSGIESDGEGHVVVLDEEEEIPADVVLFGTGVRPRLELAEEAGLEVRESGVVTDEAMRTSDPDVFAVGDIAFAMNSTAGQRQKVEHWGDALGHGAVAGTVIAGGEAEWDAAPGFWSTIGERSLKYWSWSGGFDEVRFVDNGNEEGESFTAWYGREGVCVGVLTHNADEDYDAGRGLVERGGALPA